MPHGTPTPTEVARRVQRGQPFGRLTPRRVHTLALEQIQPVLRIAHRVRSPALTVAPRIIFDHEFLLILAGHGRLIISGEERPFQPNDLFLIPPFQPHWIESRPGAACDHIAVHWDYTPRAPALGRDPSRRQPYEIRLAAGRALPRQVRLLRQDRLEREFLELVAARESASPAAGLRMTGCLLRIIAALLEREPPAATAEAEQNRARVQRALDHLHARLAEPLTVAGLARVAGLSGSHFTRVFRDWTGHSPLDYLRRQRIDLARQLLAGVELSIKEIADRAGFRDPYHFSRAFRQLDGLSPSEYRAAALAGRRG